MDRYELAWAAGFFDGEGWANATKQTGRRTGQPHAQVNQADPHGVPEVLLRFQRALGGLGRIAGPDVKDGRKDLYRWVVSSRGDVELLHHFLLPWLGQVKLDELALALSRPAGRSRSPRESMEWLRWSAGLFDGEGCASMYQHRSHIGYLSQELAVTQSSLQGRPEVLERFQLVMGAGRIYGPYRQAKSQPVYRWKATGRSDVERVIEMLLPWISPVKLDQVSLVREILAAQPPLPRGRPDWGNRKTHCVRGHEYATARIRPYRPRGKAQQRRDSKQCLVCAREQARARRDATKRSAADDDRRLSELRAPYLLK